MKAIVIPLSDVAPTYATGRTQDDLFQTGPALGRRHTFVRGPDADQESGRIMMCARTGVGCPRGYLRIKTLRFDCLSRATAALREMIFYKGGRIALAMTVTAKTR